MQNATNNLLILLSRSFLSVIRIVMQLAVRSSVAWFSVPKWNIWRPLPSATSHWPRSWYTWNWSIGRPARRRARS